MYQGVYKKGLDYKTMVESLEDCNLCIVLSLTFNKIITTYWNKISDNHEMLNMRKYNSNLVVGLPGVRG